MSEAAKATADEISGSALILNSPVARAFTVVGDRWAGLILRDAFLGVRQFEVFRKRSGAARGTLSSRLKSLVEHDILQRRAYQQTPVRYEYRLTKKGLDLYGFILSVWDWEIRWSKETHIPPRLHHRSCGKDMRPLFRCSDCHVAVGLRDVTYQQLAQAGPPETVPARFQRRTPSSKHSRKGVDRRFFHVLDVIGDRWTGLVVAAMYFGLNRYDEIATALGIATNILADRLKVLVDAEILEQVPYQQKPIRYQYRLTEKGAALYPIALQLHEWASRWLFEDEQASIALSHNSCRASLQTELVCSACEQPLNVHNVTFAAEYSSGS
jgi:DNA-binding HxlR family transcriptional regulator